MNMMSKELDLLDEVEEIRQKAAEHPEQYTVDYAIRLASAYVAAYAGYKNRNDWTSELKKHPESKYATRMTENNFHVQKVRDIEMRKSTITFAVKTKNGVVTEIGRSSLLQPKTNFKGGSIKWFDDSKLLKSAKA